MTMNKFFKSKSKKELKIETKKSLEAEKNKRQKTEIMGSAIEKLASNFRGVNKDINNDSTGVNGKNQGSLRPSTPGPIERPKKIHKEKNQVDNREAFKRVEIEETLITKQSKLLIKKGPDDKIVVARQTQTTEQSTKFTKSYLNGDPLEEVSSTTQDDQSSLINVANNLDKVSDNSNENLSLKNDLKTYKNAQRVIGLNDTSESDSTILLMPCHLKKKKKKSKNSKNNLSKNKKLALNNTKVNSLENKESEIIKSVDLLSDSDQKNNPPLSKEDLVNKKMGCKIQDEDVTDSESTLSSTPIESQNITTIDSVNDSDTTVFLTPVEQNTSVVNNTHEVDSDSTIFLTPTDKPKNCKKKMKETSSESSEEPPKKKSKNIQTCEKVNQLNESIYKVPEKFSSKEFKEKFIKIVKEEKLKKKIVAVFKHGGPAQTETLPTSSQELKDKLDKILGDEGLVDNNKEPKIDELREKFSEMFGDDVLKSQIEPPPTLSNEEVLNILKPNQHVNTTVDTSLSERDLAVDKKENSRVNKSKVEKKKSWKINGEKLFRKTIQERYVKNSKVGEEKEEMEDTLKLLDESLSLNKNENSVINKSKAEKKKSLKINGEKSSRKIIQDESNVKKSKVVEEKEEMEDTLKLLDESLSLNKEENSFINKPKAEKKKSLKINGEKSSRKIIQDESNVKKSKVVGENEEMELEELEDTLKLDASNDSQSRELEETLKLPEIPEPVNYELVEVGDLKHQSYNEESDDGTDSSFGKLVIDESPDATIALLNTSNLNEIDFEKDSIVNEKDPLYVDNNDYPLAICVLEDENHSDVAHSEQQQVNSLKENNESDSRGRLTDTQEDNFISLKKLDTRELLIVVERVDVDKFKRKKSVKVVNSLKARSSLKKKISLENSRADPFDLGLEKELRVVLEGLPLKVNQNTLKNKNRINATEPKNKIVRKFNNSRKRINKIIKHKTGRKNQILLKELRIILTPIKLKNDQNLKNKHTINETLTSSAVNKKLTKKTRKSQNKNKPLSLVSKSTRKRLDNSKSAKEIKKISKAKSSSKVVKKVLNNNNLARKRKLKSNLKAITTKSNLPNLSQHQNLKELKVTLERISTGDLAKWRKKNSTRSKVTQRSKVSSQ